MHNSKSFTVWIRGKPHLDDGEVHGSGLGIRDEPVALRVSGLIPVYFYLLHFSVLRENQFLRMTTPAAVAGASASAWNMAMTTIAAIG